MDIDLLCICILGLAFLAGCSSGSDEVTSSEIHARTFDFVGRKSEAPSYADDRAAVHSMIQSAISENLAARGLIQATASGDVIVAYLVITENNVSTSAISDYFSYRKDCVHDVYTEGKNPDHFEAGTLLIDIIDPKSFRLLKRGYATRPIMRHLSTDSRDARIREVVDEILRDVRIAP